MPKLSSAASLATALAAAVLGADGAPALAAPCTSDALSTYLSGGANATCTVLDKTITGVLLTTSNAALFGADNVFIDPVAAANNPGLTFVTTELSPGPGFTVSGTIAFTITAPSSDPMTDASAAVPGGFASTPPPPSSFQVSETLSNGASLSITNFTTPVSTNFAAATSLTATDAVTVTNAFVPNFSNQFSETPAAVPEASSLALLGVALPAFGLARWRKRFKDG